MAIKKPRNIISNLLRPVPALVIALTLVGFKVFEASGFAVEDLQTLVFPIIAISVLYLPRNTQFRIPLAAFGCAIFLWLGSALEVRGFMPVRSSGQGVFLANLEGDSERYYSRERLRLYNLIAKAYDLPHMTMVHRRFSTPVGAHNWLNKQRKGIVLLFGGQKWTQGVFKSEGWQYLQSPIHNLEGFELPNPVIEEIHKLKINLRDDAFVVSNEDLEMPLFLQVTPERFQLPSIPGELFNRFLAWLSGGLREKLYGMSQSVEEKSMRRDYFNEAASVVGPWLSNAPRGLGKFFVASDDTVNALAKEPSLFRCALKQFREGAAFATIQEAPEINAAIFNNAGVAMLLQATERKHFAKASQWLWHAAITVDSNGQPVLGAKLAMLNVIMLDRAGLLDY